MNGTDHLRLEQLFDAAMDLAPAQQRAFLARECAGDSALRSRLEELLMADREPTIEPLVEPLQSAIDGAAAIGLAETLGTTSEGASASAGPSRAPVDDGLPKVGERIAQYELIRELGRGGMGIVYLARDTKLARRVAIKFLVSGQGASERFLIEARATARCTHENIVVIHEVGEYRGTPFMVLEYVQGQPLSRLLDRERPADGDARATVSPQRAVELMIPVARALSCAHEHGIIHRDLKPENIIVTDTGTIKVLDFGIAKLRARVTGGVVGALTEPESLPSMVDIRPPMASATRTGALLGTLPYMSPEQWRGPEHVDHRTDIWAVGIMLYELVCGHHPLRPQGGEDLVVTGDLDMPMPSARREPGVPAELCELIDTCLRKRKSERMDSAETLHEALTAMLPGRRGRALAASESPYPGLISFQESDAHRYFGRTRELANALVRLRSQPLLGIAGPTGIGKSSFVRAGLIPALRDSGERWEALLVRPGRDPFGALASLLLPWVTWSTGDRRADSAADAIEKRSDMESRERALKASGNGEHGREADHADEHRRLADKLRTEPGYLGAVLRKRAHQRASKILLVVDPFEELYTLSADADERAAFTISLAGVADDASAPVRLVVSIRSDFLDRVAEDQFFMTELTAGLLFLPPPDEASLRAALTGPAELAGYRFESDAMVTRILSEVEGTSGALPLLQFTATQLWSGRDRERRLLTEASYRSIGGIVGALASHADQVVHTLAQISPRALEVIQAIMRRLVTPERTRALTSMNELRQLSDEPGQVGQILDRLVEARLLVVHSSEDESGAAVELIHDSLIHTWPKLRRWLDESADDHALLSELRAAAKNWRAKGRPQDLLWWGDTLAKARRWHRRWHRRYQGRLAATEAEFLQAAFARADRATRRRRLLVVGTMAALVIIAAAALLAVVSIRQAETKAKNQAQNANQALTQLEAQLQVVKEEKQQRQRAETRADDVSARARATDAALDRTTVELRDKVVALQAAIERASVESARARRAQQDAERARARAEQAAEDARQANATLNKKLAKERALIEQLERKAGKINRTLK